MKPIIQFSKINKSHNGLTRTLNVCKKCAALIFSRPRLARTELVEAQKIAHTFEPSKGSTSGIRRWTTEALHPPFITFIGTVQFLFAVILLVSFSGCSIKSADESSHPLFRMAVKAQKANENKLAIKYFNRYLAVRPDSAKAHLLIASIYDENLDKPLNAIYHYQQFLELAPKSPEAENVKKWLEAAQRKFYNRSRLKYNDPEDVSSLQNTLYSTELEFKKLKAENVKLKAESRKLKLIQKRLVQYARNQQNKEKALGQKLDELQNKYVQAQNKIKEAENKITEITAQKKENEKTPETEKTAENEKTDDNSSAAQGKEPEKITDTTENKAEKGKIEDKNAVPEEKNAEKSEQTDKNIKTPDTVAEKPVSAPPFQMEKPVPSLPAPVAKRNYTVQKGDSLSSISRRFYGSSRYYKLIFEANRTILPTAEALKPGQVLEIPLNPKE